MRQDCSGLKLRFCASIFSGLFGKAMVRCTLVDPTCLEDEAGLDQIWCEDWSMDNRLENEHMKILSFHLDSHDHGKCDPVPDVGDVGLLHAVLPLLPHHTHHQALLHKLIRDWNVADIKQIHQHKGT